MHIFNKVSALKLFIEGAKSQGKTIGFVPTMGALHAGHLHLVTEAKNKADIVIASIFVNPTQFGPNEDFAKYPRKQEEDTEKLNTVNCNAVFIPDVGEVYPSGNSELITHNPQLEKYFNILCGAFRPGHFAGVVQVVKRLFDIVTPDYAFFGEKDFQQLFIIRKMVELENLPIKIIGVPTQRDEYGLALSSRNAYLSSEELNVARKLNIFLRERLEGFKSYSSLRADLAKQSRQEFNSQLDCFASARNDGITSLLNLGFTKVDYIEFRNSLTLELESIYSDKTRIIAAAYIGKTRLIDNLKL